MQIEQTSVKLAAFLNALRATEWTEKDAQVVEEGGDAIVALLGKEELNPRFRDKLLLETGAG